MDYSEKTCKKGLKNHHRILHIPNILGIELQLKLAILNFWTKLT